MEKQVHRGTNCSFYPGRLHDKKTRNSENNWILEDAIHVHVGLPPRRTPALSKQIRCIYEHIENHNQILVRILFFNLETLGDYASMIFRKSNSCSLSSITM